MEPRAQVLKAAFDVSHFVLMSVIGDMDDADGAFVIPGGTVPPARAILAHALLSEDLVVHRQARGADLVLVSGGFSASGIDEPSPAMTPEWLATAFDMDGLRAYAGGLFAATEAFLQSATAAELDRLVSTPLGTTVTAAEAMASFAVVHLSVHAGELSAIKGAGGGRGLPF